jgi:hypothetical protein
MEISRRTFLKITGAAGAGIALPGLQLVPLAQASAEPVGFIREVAAYDIGLDKFVVRHDILTDDGQWHVTQKLVHGFSSLRGQEDLEERRKVAFLILGNQLRHEGKTWRDLRYLPLPEGVDGARHVKAP